MAGQACMLIYNLAGKQPKEKAAIIRKLYGYEDRSNMGRYRYEREGICSKIRHIKPADNTIICPEHESRKIENFFKSHSINYTKWKILLDEAL
ncbi:MAG: hypothetical protein HY519_00465 [Candidatus Aenigmarchaeota archaeon]|nr:hypothetical protein [Candidatus Aenigmarchaeota archaeon]